MVMEADTIPENLTLSSLGSFEKAVKNWSESIGSKLAEKLTEVARTHNVLVEDIRRESDENIKRQALSDLDRLIKEHGLKL